MSTLDIINEHIARWPEALRVELLHYALFLEEKAAMPEPGGPSDTDRRAALVAGFTELEGLGTFADIADPVVWQREIRHDRLLPGREEEVTVHSLYRCGSGPGNRDTPSIRPWLDCGFPPADGPVFPVRSRYRSRGE